MNEIKSKIETETIKRETFVISGKVLKLFKKYLKTTILSKQKLKIMDFLDIEEYKSLEEISKNVFPKKNSSKALPLLCYHINGSRRSEGLLGAEMVDKENMEHGKVGIRLNSFGDLILKECKKY